ncbi:unnamed protein product [Brassica oleracea var. botrytis]
MKRDIHTCIERIFGGFPENLQKRDNYTCLCKTKEPKQVQGRGRKGHDVEVEHEEDDATTSEQQPIEKQAEEFSGEWDTNVPEQAVIVGEEQGMKGMRKRVGREKGVAWESS